MVERCGERYTKRYLFEPNPQKSVQNYNKILT